MEQIKVIVKREPQDLERSVNAFLSALDGEMVSITFAAAPWAADGQAGTEFVAFVLWAPYY